MAGNRKRIVEAPALNSWEDVDRALREVAEEQLALSDIEADMNRQIIGVKRAAEQESKPHLDRISKLEKDLKEYVEEHRAELGNRKTMQLNFGEVGFRLSTTISLPKAKDRLEEVLRRLRARGMKDCIVTKESVNKDALRQYGEERVIAVGAGWKQKDIFWYEAAKDKLERQQTGQA